MMSKISIVVPIFNEEGVLDEFATRVVNLMDSLKERYQCELIFALDPSTDGTEEKLERYAGNDPRIKYLKFSRRVGQPMATVAGIDHAEGDACIVIDVDLQDPPELIPELLHKWEEGYDVVLPQRRSRKGETFIKMAVSSVGYYLMNKITSVRIPREIGDFRLMSRRVVEELKRFRTSHGFLRGMVSYVGFKQITLPYDREIRKKGQSKYNPFLGSLKIGLNSLVCFSTFLLTLGYTAGFAMILVSFLTISYGLLNQWVLAGEPPRNTLLILSAVFFVGGVQLILMGVLGEYVGRTYEEVQDRPRYIVDKKVNFIVAENERGPRP